MYGVWLSSSYCLAVTGYHPPLRFEDMLWGIPYLSSGEPVRHLSPATASFKASKNFRFVLLSSAVCSEAPHKSVNTTILSSQTLCCSFFSHSAPL
ncbi:hypothetical protein AVEN_73106-1 [Araneus ventricosus]|uniref:Uncharacterized protein n=1 Tax=Araneus ventricosus TaxID=182803 RepID=A0A4Y2IZM1_ARAVE|nr:hypothetical protein AVEN_73106-1 [Araneus ventricosus]